MNMGGRIKLRLEELGWGQIDLLNRVPELEVGTLSALITRDSKRSVFAPQIAAALGVRLEWLISGEGDKLFGKQKSNVTPGPDIKTVYPLISWISAGTFCDAVDLFQPGDAEDWFPSTKKHSPHTYVLRVQGDSMVSPYPGQRTYLPGCLIFVDPERSVTNGCRVIAKLPDQDAATFKCYTEDGGRRYLKPLNPQYPTIEMTPDIQICGVVVSMSLDE